MREEGVGSAAEAQGDPGDRRVALRFLAEWRGEESGAGSKGERDSIDGGDGYHYDR